MRFKVSDETIVCCFRAATEMEDMVEAEEVDTAVAVEEAME